MMTFDRTLPELLSVCEADSDFAAQPSRIKRACAVRDPRGQVRLVVELSRDFSELAVDALKSRLTTALERVLDKFFVPPVLTTQDKEASGAIARALLEKAKPWHEAAYDDPIQGGKIKPSPGRWQLMERRVAKQGWLDARKAGDPWPLSARLPVVTFYSFKGGGGRTTALVSCALQLADQGKRVAVVDLDLEAPGLGPLFEVSTSRGVLDAIVDHMATERIDLDGLHASPSSVLPPDIADQIDVFPAGNLDQFFLEKLSRLDFSEVGPWGDEKTIPVHRALRALLTAIKRKLKPAYILLDARAGLHDLAGLSLHGLAHVDVLVTRSSEQAYRGLDLTVRALGQRIPEDELRCVTVHGLAPPDPESPEGKAEIAEVRARAYKSFSDHVYGDVPAEEDATAAHFPWLLRRNPNLDRFTTLASVLNDLRTDQHKKLLDRIVELCTPEDPPPDEEGSP
ncbi:MAG TPA: hypothetical protein VL242_23095 [Sorangium sp.]|nr:hypothetical protein [Sorangium sp.]